MRWLVLLLCLPLHAMDVESGRAHTIRYRSSNRDDDVQEITDLITSFYFSDAEPCVINKIAPKIKQEIQRLKERQQADHEDTLRQLQELRHKTRSKRHSHSPRYHPDELHAEFADMRRHLSRVVADALKEEFDELDEDLGDLRRQLKKESIQKWAALACGCVGTSIAAIVALIVHFVEGSGCST